MTRTEGKLKQYIKSEYVSKGLRIEELRHTLMSDKKVTGSKFFKNTFKEIYDLDFREIDVTQEEAVTHGIENIILDILILDNDILPDVIDNSLHENIKGKEREFTIGNIVSTASFYIEMIPSVILLVEQLIIVINHSHDAPEEA